MDDDNLRTLAKPWAAMMRTGASATEPRWAPRAEHRYALLVAADAIHGLASGADCERVLRMMAEEVGRA